MARSINKNLKSSISIEVSSFNPAQRKPVEPKLEYKDQYLTFEALENCIFTLTIPAEINQDYMTSISYSINNGKTWTTTQINNTNQIITTPTIKSKKTILWKGEGLALNINTKKYFNSTEGISQDFPYKSSIFSSSAKFNIFGNIMSLLYGNNFKNKTTFPLNGLANFGNLFKNAQTLINAKNLVLPISELTYYCYSYMFQGCTSLITPPKLPATILNEGCYAGMFSGCISLSTAPSLPATILSHSCYFCMFDYCQKLTIAPELPATTLANWCYGFMFNKCTSLINAPTLPSTVVTEFCYASMFRDCTSLKTAPELPATTVVYSCYMEMFKNCISLIIAPILPAIILADSCYDYMFYDCSNLSYIKMLATNISADRCLLSWVTNVSTTGTFVKNSLAQWNNNNIVPQGWTVETASE